MQKILIRTVQSLIRKTPRCGYSGITAAVAQKHNAPVWQKLSFIPQFNFASYDQIMAGKKEIEALMKTVKLSDGQDIVSKNLIQDIVIGDNGEVTMEISFDKNFKQTKKLIMKSLQEIPWVTKVEVKMAVEDEEEDQSS